MRLTIYLTAALALVACSKQAEAPASTNSTDMNATTPEPTPAAMVTANGSTPGTFDVVAKDGTKSQSVLNPDGTYVDKDATGKEMAKGTWNVTNGKTCFDPDGDKGPDCYAETAVAADGTFTATSDKGEQLTIKKVS